MNPLLIRNFWRKSEDHIQGRHDSQGLVIAWILGLNMLLQETTIWGRILDLALLKFTIAAQTLTESPENHSESEQDMAQYSTPNCFERAYWNPKSRALEALVAIGIIVWFVQ